MADKVKEVAIGEAERIKVLTADAARSGAYLYPIRVSTFIVTLHFHSICTAACILENCKIPSEYAGLFMKLLPASPLFRIMINQALSGNRILRLPSPSMETSHLETRANVDPRTRHHDIHVCLHLPTPGRNYGFHEWSSCSH